MTNEPKGYQTYLLRLWYVQVQGKTQWRASIESPHTGERQLFASLEQLFAFVGERCESQASSEPEVERRDMEEEGHVDRLNGKW